MKRYYLSETGNRKPSVGRKLRIIISEHGIHAIAVYRLTQYVDSVRLKAPLLPFKYAALSLCHFLNFVVKLFCEIHIDRTAVIESGLCIGHFGGIYIGRCHIGRNCTIHQQVRIGQHSVPDRELPSPWIGDNVYIGPHAVINGPVRIGHNATVSAGSVVKSDVKENSLVAGNPARVIKLNYVRG